MYNYTLSKEATTRLGHLAEVIASFPSAFDNRTTFVEGELSWYSYDVTTDDGTSYRLNYDPEAASVVGWCCVLGGWVPSSRNPNMVVDPRTDFRRAARSAAADWLSVPMIFTSILFSPTLIPAKAFETPDLQREAAKALVEELHRVAGTGEVPRSTLLIPSLGNSRKSWRL